MKGSMKPIEFDWKEGTTSIVWERPDCGIIRFHEEGDTDEHPKYRGVCFAKVGSKWKTLDWIINRLITLNSNGICEFKAMSMNSGHAYPKEHRAVKSHLWEVRKLACFSRRLRNGEVVVKWY